MALSLYHKPSGFTLIEIMIVISMIAILLSTGIFPYSYYMERARVEKTVDKISQEWIIAHQNIRG
jgi:prepilin-type N-terminal cleavage/methylation domain-containing protein